MNPILVLNPEKITKEQASTYRTRMAARGVVIDEDNNIALLPVTAHHYYKLPGGGIEEGEEKEEAFKRECMEEIGCNVEILQELGPVVEYRSEFSLVQTSYCYLAKTIGEKKKATFTEHEVENGFQEALWISLDEAIKLMESQADNYEGKFIVERDTFILKKVKDFI